MKWLLVNQFDEIVDTCEIASGVGESGAKTYFMGIKQMEEESFDKLWKVMSRERYDRIFQSTLQNRQYKWWEEDKGITKDDDNILG
tara:strand:+ start:263 stop:520 length:258 start_codon:yes stop_codon:yes gene_type:complete